jgi:hypothetical protein
MQLSAALFGAVALLLLVALAVAYLVSRGRKGETPDHAEEHAHTGSYPTGDHNPVPEEPGSGMPMVVPDEADERSVEEMQERAGEKRPAPRRET